MIYHVFANRTNLGDWLSAQAIQMLLTEALGFRPPLVECLCDEPFVPETLSRLEQSTDPGDGIVIGAGGLFMDYFAPFWEGFRSLADHLPFVIWGVGLCDMKREPSRLSKALLAPVLRNRNCKLCVVRDERTRDYLGSDRIGPAVACPTTTLITPRPVGFGLLHVDAYDNVGPENYEIMETVGQRFANRTGRRFRSINNLIPSGDRSALATMLHHYESADLILTGRLHGCIIGLAMGRKVLAVSGDHKVESFMRAAGLSDWVLDLDELKQLPERLAALPGQRPPEDYLAEARNQNRRIARFVADTLMPLATTGSTTTTTTTTSGRKAVAP